MQDTRKNDPQKQAQATLETMRKVFTLPESDQSTLARLDREISENLLGFLKGRIVAGDIAPANLEQDFMETAIPEDPLFVSQQVDFLLQKVVAQSVHTSAPSFIGHMTSALPYFMMPLAKIMMALNQNLVKIETSKAFTPLERQVIGMLHRLIYNQPETYYEQWTQSLTHSLGVFCSGGTIANITALWVARNTLLNAGDPEGAGGVSDVGLFRAFQASGYSDLAIVVSKRGHYSLRKAANVLGIGRDNLVTVDTDAHHKIDLKKLAATVQDLKKKKVGIVALVGVAGTTETGNVDPLAAMADIAGEHKIHFHVDAAWGGPVLFSERYRHLLAGIERADSVTFDAHKQLYVPMGAGMALFRSETALTQIEHHANYIIRRGSRDIGKHTLEGSRPGMAMLVHSGLRIIGRKGYELLIDLGIGKAGQFAKMIQAAPDFEVVSEPELNLLTYRWVPADVKTALGAVLAEGRAEQAAMINELLNELTEQIQKMQRARGRSFVSRTRFECHRHNNVLLNVFRVVLANPLTTRQILAEILEEQREYGKICLGTDHLGERLDQACRP
jgi:glutamate decarboxylase